MQKALIKFRLIYLPSLLIYLAWAAVYILLFWLLDIKLEWITLHDELSCLLPLCIVALPVALWIDRRFKLLVIKDKKTQKDNRFGVMLLISIPFGAVTFFAQNYTEKASGHLTPLSRINEISNHPKTKYYSLSDGFYDKKRVAYYNTWGVSGKHDEDLDMKIYMATPLFNYTGDSLNKECGAWLCYLCQKSISNNISKSEKDTAWDKFYHECWAEYDKTDLTKYIYLNRLIDSSSEGKGYAKAIARDSAISTKKAPMLSSVNEPFETRYSGDIKWLSISLISGALLLLLVVLIPKLDMDRVATFHDKKAKDVNKGFKEFIELVKPHKRFIVTQFLVYANTIVFLAMVFAGLGFLSFSAEDLLKWGADYKPLVDKGEYLRVISGMFLHDGIMHLFGNMYGLVVVGVFMEPFIGRKWFAGIYFSTGIVAAITSMQYHGPVVSVGASGAIFGLYGAFLVLILSNIYPGKAKKGFLVLASLFIGINLLYGLKGSVDNAAHIGGLVSGIVAGFIIVPFVKQRLEKENTQPDVM